PMEQWIELFAGRGFVRNVDLDASFVAPHSVHLVRSQGTVAPVARDYERWYWRHRNRLERALAQAENAGESWREEAQLAAAELAEWDAFRGRSGYRIFLRLARLRGRLAPAGTTRDR